MSQPSLTTPVKVSLAKRSDRQNQRTVVTARLSNSYLQDGAKMASILRYLQLALIAGLLIVMSMLVSFSRQEFRVFPTSVDGKLIVLPPLSRDLGDNTVLLWLTDILRLANTMGHHDFRLRLEDIRPYFTERGWESFNRYMRAHNRHYPSLRVLLEDYKMISIPRIGRPPQILRKGVVSGIFSYDIRADVFMRRVSLYAPWENQVTFDIGIERVPTDINPSGIAITRWRTVQAQP